MGVPGVYFNESGVCNYCRLHDVLEQQWPMGDAGQQTIEALTQEMKARGEGKDYDCVVGLSGGTDSTYLLYLAKKLELRPLAVHFDGGWNSEIAVHNIKQAVAKLDVDLYTYVVDWEEFKDILITYLKASLPWADAPTDMAIDATLYRVAAKEGIGYILNGSSFRTEGKMPTEWTYTDARTINQIHKRFGKRSMKTFPNLTLMDFIYYSFIKRIRLVRILNHMAYHKNEARCILEKELDWQYYGGHHFESTYTRFAYTFWLPRKFGIDKRKITHSALVRYGEMTRDEALAELQALPASEDQINEDIKYVRQKLDLTMEEFTEIMDAPPRTYLDYPSYYPMIQRMKGIIRPAFKIALRWTPPMFYEMDVRKNSSPEGNR
jgi:N-acetyl sugar amidotransferase